MPLEVDDLTIMTPRSRIGALSSPSSDSAFVSVLLKERSGATETSELEDFRLDFSRDFQPSLNHEHHDSRTLCSFFIYISSPNVPLPD